MPTGGASARKGAGPGAAAIFLSVGEGKEPALQQIRCRRGEEATLQQIRAGGSAVAGAGVALSILGYASDAAALLCGEDICIGPGKSLLHETFSS